MLALLLSEVASDGRGNKRRGLWLRGGGAIEEGNKCFGKNRDAVIDLMFRVS